MYARRVKEFRKLINIVLVHRKRQRPSQACFSQKTSPLTIPQILDIPMGLVALSKWQSTIGWLGTDERIM